MRNNLVYNWGYFAAMLSRNPLVNFVANDYKPGPESRKIVPLCDTDSDGITEEWERKNGLDPKNPADAIGIGADGNAPVERFAHGK